KDLAKMIPGMNKIDDEEIDDDAFKSIEAIIGSMTPEERENPRIINGSRKRRIALGSGNSIEEVNRLIKQFEETSKMMRMVTTGGAKKMMQMMQQAKRRR
ncbi:MAG: signal recognition particle protein, partial [Bacteroidales bacterium]|nr:signal recognition particle protein [Bacteroidales bacterium]